MFAAPYILHGPAAIANYDITRNGDWFLMVKSGAIEKAGTDIHVVVNWMDELKEIVPAK